MTTVNNVIPIFHSEDTEARMTPEGLYSVFDFFRLRGRKYYRQDWYKVQKIKPEVRDWVDFYQFPGKGQRPIPVADLETCEKLLAFVDNDFRSANNTQWDNNTSDKFFPRTEQQIVAVIVEAFSDLNPIPQFYCFGYEIDIYFPTIRLAIEIDEDGHKSYKKKEELRREKLIKDALGCEFSRWNPYAQEFNLGEMIRSIRGHVEVDHGR